MTLDTFEKRPSIMRQSYGKPKVLLTYRENGISFGVEKRGAYENITRWTANEMELKDVIQYVGIGTP